MQEHLEECKEVKKNKPDEKKKEKPEEPKGDGKEKTPPSTGSGESTKEPSIKTPEDRGNEIPAKDDIISEYIGQGLEKLGTLVKGSSGGGGGGGEGSGEHDSKETGKKGFAKKIKRIH